FGPRVRVLTSAGVGPKRQLPLRARSSTGWAGRALRYDSGLMAHRCSRAAPKCPGPPVLLVLDWGWKDLMISLRRHFVPNPVQVNYCSRLGTRRRRPLFIHTWYDCQGDLTSESDNYSSYTYGYDSLGRQKSATSANPGQPT